MPTNRGGDHEAVYRCYCELVAGRASHGHVLESVIRGDPQHKRLVKGHGAGVFSEAEIRCATDLRPAWRAAAHKGQAANDPFDDAYQAGFWIHLHEDRYVRQDNDSKLYRGQRNADWTNTGSLFRPGKLSPELRRDRLLSLAGTLADRFGLDDTHAFVACQHYAEMARLDGDDEGFGATESFKTDWLKHNCYNSWQARRDLLNELFEPVQLKLDRQEEAQLRAVNAEAVSPHTKTSWPKVDEELMELRRRFRTASTRQDYRDVGNRSVAVLEALSRTVYDPRVHLREGLTEPPADKTEERIGRYVEDSLAGEDNEAIRGVVNKVSDLAHSVKHSTAPTRREAGIAADSVVMLANILRRVDQDF